MSYKMLIVEKWSCGHSRDIVFEVVNYVYILVILQYLCVGLGFFFAESVCFVD